jgi:RNA polymerase sigma-B factor
VASTAVSFGGSRRPPDELARRRRMDEQLIRRHREGAPNARHTLIERYIPLARSLAMRYSSAEPLEDLVQVACVGLIKAVDRWDPDRGFAFSSFAVPTIVGELRRHFRDHTWNVRPPRRLQEVSLTVEAARDELRTQAGREPTLADLADRLGRSCTEVSEAIHAAEGRHLRSLDLVVGEPDGDAAPIGELIGCEDEGYERFETSATVERLTAGLDRRAREVLRLRFEDGLLQSEIGERVGCTQMHVSRIIRASLEQLAADAGTSLAA